MTCGATSPTTSCSIGMVAMFFHGWQRLIDAFGILPDRWREGDPLPFGPLRSPAD